MYYQTRVNLIDNANSIEEIVANFHNQSRKVHGYRLMIEGKEHIFVQDDYICDLYVRNVAVVNQTEGYEMGSIWFAFNDNADFMVKWLKEVVSDNQKQVKGIVPVEPLQCLFIGYTCDFCGERFHSNIQKQSRYRLGKGLGICNDCEKYVTPIED
jgi:hypothetical protein